MGKTAPNSLDIVGERFGRLKVIKRTETNKKWSYWEVKCDCGNVKVVRGTSLKCGDTKSCGCFAKEAMSRAKRTHYDCENPLYKIWGNMKSRCKNANHQSYYLYGARGIKVCKRWDKYENFKKDMYREFLIHRIRYGRDNTTLERVDNDGDYTPENCRWSTWKEQSINNRNIKPFVGIRIKDGHRDIGHSQIAFAKKYGLCNTRISLCLTGKAKTYRGWKFELIKE